MTCLSGNNEIRADYIQNEDIDRTLEAIENIRKPLDITLSEESIIRAGLVNLTPSTALDAD